MSVTGLGKLLISLPKLAFFVISLYKEREEQARRYRIIRSRFPQAQFDFGTDLDSGKLDSYYFGKNARMYRTRARAGFKLGDYSYISNSVISCTEEFPVEIGNSAQSQTTCTWGPLLITRSSMHQPREHHVLRTESINQSVSLLRFG
jgi:hypothetical protein